MPPLPNLGKRNQDRVWKMHGVQCKMARAALGWGVRDIAAAAKVSTDTILRLERGEKLKPRTLDDIRSTFEAAGIEFIPENGKGPGVILLNRLNQGKQVGG